MRLHLLVLAAALWVSSCSPEVHSNGEEGVLWFGCGNDACRIGTPGSFPITVQRFIKTSDGGLDHVKLPLDIGVTLDPPHLATFDSTEPYSVGSSDDEVVDWGTIVWFNEAQAGAARIAVDTGEFQDSFFPINLLEIADLQLRTSSFDNTEFESNSQYVIKGFAFDADGNFLALGDPVSIELVDGNAVLTLDEDWQSGREYSFTPLEPGTVQLLLSHGPSGIERVVSVDIL